VASTIITHIIGSTILIGVLIATTLYSGYLLNIVKTNNLSEIYRALAERIASDLRTELINAYMKNINNTVIQLILPVEAASLEGYNVYIGKGVELVKLFPRLSSDPSYNNDAVYVVVSSPDQIIYSYSLVVSPNDLPVNVLLARGKLLIEREKVGFDPARGYSEGGVPWLCRQAFNITERSGVKVSSFKYLVNISINPSNLTCRYGDLLVTPKPDGSDIRFTMDDGVTPLRYWIESWSPSKAIVWVEIPDLSPNSNRTIYMYWGAPFAVDRSDKSIFPFYDDLDKYISKDDLKDAWSVISENASYTVYGNGSWLVVSATYSGQGYVNIFSRTVFNTSMYPGLIAEFYGAPIDTEEKNKKNDVNYKAGFYAEYPGFSKYNITFIPKVIDPTSDLVNYTIIYGNWSIGLNETTLNRYLDAYNYTYVNQKYIALAVRQNPTPGIPPGQEYYQILYKVRVLNDGVYRGIYVAGENTTSTKYYGFLLSWNNTNGLCLYGYGGGNNPAEGEIKLLESTPCNQSERLDENGKWYYILLDVQGPGSANDVKVLVYDEDGNTILEYSKNGADFTLQPDYVGPLAVSMGNPPQYNSSFDDLVSARSNTRVDLRYINVTGLPEGWSACLSDAVYNSNTSKIGYALIGCGESVNGVAVINVSTHPILGVLAPPILQIFDDSLRLVDSIPIYINISGGTVIKYTGLSEDGGLVSALIKGVDDVKCDNTNVKNQYLATYGDSSKPLCNYGWTTHTTSIGYYNGSFYYFIDGGYVTKYDSRLPVETLRLVFGVESSSEKTNTNTNTTGIYKWVRVRPFVYPEPLVTPWGTPEGAQVPKPPTLAIESYQGYIVFSSKLLVDLGIIIRSDGVLVAVVIIHGVRSA